MTEQFHGRICLRETHTIPWGGMYKTAHNSLCDKTKNNLYVRKRINAHIVIYSYNGISDSYDNE